MLVLLDFDSTILTCEGLGPRGIVQAGVAPVLDWIPRACSS